MHNVQIVTPTSAPATGTITSSTASQLTLPKTTQVTLITNRSGQIAYFKLNETTGNLEVSSTVYDFALEDKTDKLIDFMSVAAVSVYVAATSGIRVVGWS